MLHLPWLFLLQLSSSVSGAAAAGFDSPAGAATGAAVNIGMKHSKPH